MRNAALPQCATVELESNFHNECGCAKRRNPSSRTVPRHENFECALRLRMPTGWGRGLCQQRGTASEWPAVVCARAPEARAACRFHTRPPIRSARDGAPSLSPSPPTPRVAAPTSRTSTRWHTSWRSGARGRGGCRCRDGRIPPHARGARPVQEEALCDCPRSPQRGQNQRRRRPRPGAARSKRGGHTHGWVQVR